jgi:hypothetical protein
MKIAYECRELHRNSNANCNTDNGDRYSRSRYRQIRKSLKLGLKFDATRIPSKDIEKTQIGFSTEIIFIANK